MMSVVRPKSSRIEHVEKREHALFLYSEAYCIRIKPQSAQMIQVSMQEHDDFTSADYEEFSDMSEHVTWGFCCQESEIFLDTEALRVAVNRDSGAISYYKKDGTLLVAERSKQARQMESFETYRTFLDENTVTKTVKTADGDKKCIAQATRIFDKMLYHTSLHLCVEESEVLYGLGQSDDGAWNLRHTTQYLNQANQKIAIPFLISLKGYGVLYATESAAVFSEGKENEISFSAYADERLEYYLIAGETPNDVIKGFRQLTGKAVMLPRWSFGYIQSVERYESQQEILDTVREFRNRGIGIDAIVLDWLSWEDGQWGQKSCDKKRFPDVDSMMKQLHEMQTHFMVSIWPNMTAISDNYKEMYAAGQILPGTELYNAFDETARQIYWKQAYEGWFSHGIDGWWCDSSEAMTPEWNHVLRKPLPFEMWKEFVEETAKVMPAGKANAYGLYHAKGIYEGQRSLFDRKQTTKGAESSIAEKRVLNLTRSGYPGSQKYGTVLWSGDIAASWTTLKQQIAAGLSFCASGMPYWTLDIGAFFVKNGMQWYWDGDYDAGNEDLGYRELYTRWYQFGAFLPMFRSHGTDCHREPWLFGNKGEVFYDAISKANELRYQLIPYIYSAAAAVWREDASMIRPLAFDFQADRKTYGITDQFLFGPSMMVCPVTEPMLYEANSMPVKAGMKKKAIYLPVGPGWYDFWTKEYYEGGQTITVENRMERIPVFVKAGGIIPRTDTVESTEASAGKEILIELYAGADGEFVLYEDAGDGYGYEKGEYALTTIRYCEADKEHGKEASYEMETTGQKQFRKGKLTVVRIENAGI